MSGIQYVSGRPGMVSRAANKTSKATATEQGLSAIVGRLAYVSDGLAGLTTEAIENNESSWAGCICQVFSKYVADTNEMFEEFARNMKAGDAV